MFLRLSPSHPASRIQYQSSPILPMDMSRLTLLVRISNFHTPDKFHNKSTKNNKKSVLGKAIEAMG